MNKLLFFFNRLEARLKAAILSIVAFFALIIIVSAIGIASRVNADVSSRITLDNYPSSLPHSEKKPLEIQLRRVLALSQSVPEKGRIYGALRSSDVAVLTDSEISSASFLVDIDEFKTTFRVSLSWSKTVSVPDGITISCPTLEETLYPDSPCLAPDGSSSKTSTLLKENPILSAFPLIIDDFDFEKRTSIHYEILGQINSLNEIVITINDYSGGNYSAALEKLSSLGYDLSTYKINYYDKTTSTSGN